MKNLMKKISKWKVGKFVKNERGQGMLEYILLVVVVVGLIMLLKPYLGQQMSSIQNQLGGSIGNILSP